jgi:hypothetical protein
MKGIMIDDNHDLQVNVRKNIDGLIVQGLVIGDITFQNQEVIIVSEKGELKHAPLTGVGVRGYLDDEMPDSLLRAIRTELSSEGMEVKKVSLNERGVLELDAKYR